MTYAAVGAFLVPTVTTTSTTFHFALSPAAVGNLLMFGVEVGASTVQFGLATGTNMLWFPKVIEGTNATLNKRVALYVGIATATGSQTQNIVLSGGTAASAGAAGHEFSSTNGTKGIWSLDATGGPDSTTASTATTDGTMQTTIAGFLRWGYTFVTNTDTGTAQTGFVFNTDSAGNLQEYNLATLATPQVAAGTQTSGASLGMSCAFKNQPHKPDFTTVGCGMI